MEVSRRAQEQRKALSYDCEEAATSLLRSTLFLSSFPPRATVHKAFPDTIVGNARHPVWMERLGRAPSHTAKSPGNGRKTFPPQRCWILNPDWSERADERSQGCGQDGLLWKNNRPSNGTVALLRHTTPLLMCFTQAATFSDEMKTELSVKLRINLKICFKTYSR